jgi:hypothetical protein
MTKKFKLRNLDIDRVDIVKRGANQHAHIVIAKSDEEQAEHDALLAAIEERNKKKGRVPGHMSEMVVDPVSKHYPGNHPHRQLNHGVWATGRGGTRDARSKEKNQIKGQETLDFNKPAFTVDDRDFSVNFGRKQNIPPSPKPPDPPTPSGPRSLSDIAREIRRDWGSKVNYAAAPYLDAMASLDKMTDRYYADSAESVVAYFLSNASSWRGETAKRVKAELKAMLKMKKSAALAPAILPELSTTTRLYAQDAIYKNALMGYPPSPNPMPPAGNPMAPPPQAPPPQAPPPMMNPNPNPMAMATPPPPLATDRAGLAEFMRARLAAMPQQPGMPPGMVGATPPVMPPAPGIPQPGSIAPQMPPPVPGQTAPAPPGAGPAPGAPGTAMPPAPGAGEKSDGEKSGGNPVASKPQSKMPATSGSKMPATSGDLARQLDAAKPGGMGLNSGNPPAPDDEEPEEEDAKRPPFSPSPKATPFR